MANHRKPLTGHQRTADAHILSRGIDTPEPDAGEGAHTRTARLRGRLADTSVDESKNSWFDGLEQVIQQSIRELTERFDNIYSASGVRDLESVIFARSLTDVGADWQGEGLRLPPELDLFTTPIALVSFQVHERSYRCAKYPPSGSGRQDGQFGGFSPEELKRYRTAIDSFSKKYSSRTTLLKSQPTSSELLAHLFDHLEEEIGANKMETLDEVGKTGGDQAVRIHEVHPARRSAIIDWQTRMEALHTEYYDHEEEGDCFYSYPVVDILVPDGMHLVLLLVSPLDENFIDEKVSADHRCAEICLALYQLGQAAYPVVIESLVSHIKQSFARVLFASMHREASQALTSSYDAQSAILRHWVSEASKGYRGLAGKSNPGEPFNAWRFCEAIVQKILCASVPGVDAEVYPFDRVFILQETGTTSRFDQDVPVEISVLEASILSNNPADRNQYLTRRERRIRGTEDFECNAGRKVIEEDNRYRFFVHGDEKRLIFTPKPHLTEEQRLEVRRGLASSLSRRGPEDFLFLIDLPEQDDDTELSRVAQNLFGRLLPENYGAKEIKDPADQSSTLVQYKGFTSEFERRRLAVTENFDANGLYYRYEHGISLAEQAPLLYQLQSAYFSYLDLKLKDQDRRFRQEALVQENLPSDKIEAILERYDRKRKLDRRLAAQGKETWTASRRASENAAKVVWLCYSWVLNDENTARILLKNGGAEGGDAAGGALLGREYRYTMILVSDQDPEKSLSQLNAERENLRLFFRLMMQRIWLDRLAERDFLESRSRTIGHSLGQFIHRAKGLMKDERSKEEIQSFYDNLRRLMEPQRVTVEQDEISSFEEVFNRLLGNREEAPVDADAISARLHTQLERWFSGRVVESSWPSLEIAASSIPPLRIRWPVGVVGEAFYVLLKNACEAAMSEQVPDVQRLVRIQIQATPEASQGRRALWFVDVVVENPGGPIPPVKLERLSAKEPMQLGQNREKSGSTGIGVYLARYQLQNMIGQGADLLFANLAGDIVQSRLRLPVEPIEPTKSPMADRRWVEPPPDVEGDYVLYIEDTPSVYQDALARIQSALPSGVALEHRMGRDAALALAQAKLPCLVFSDLHIPRDEEGAEAPARKFGAGFLKGIMKVAKDKSSYPPIWVMTAEPETDVREELGDVSGSGYRFVVASGSSPKQLAQPGTICVFGDKRPDQVPQFTAFLNELFVSTSEDQHPDSESPTMRTETLSRPALRVVSLPLEAIDSDELATTYSELHSFSPPGILIVRDACAELSHLEQDLSAWFVHPGLPDPDEAEARTLYRLTEHVWHRDLALALMLEEKLFRRLPIQLLYWALSKNLWLETSPQDDEELARTWRLIRNENKGPLSLLRHDLMNQWSSPDLEPLLRSMTEKISICEKKVRLSDKDRQALNSMSVKGSESKIQLKEYLRRTGVVASDRVGFRRGLQELDAILSAVPGKDPELQLHVDEHRFMLQALDDYLGGS